MVSGFLSSVGPGLGGRLLEDHDIRQERTEAPIRSGRETVGMCRSIKTLRPPVLPEEATEEEIRAAALQFVRKVNALNVQVQEEIRAAALQYVRKVSGFRAPAAHNQEVFDRAVEVIAEATAELLAGLEVRGAPRRAAG